MYLLDDILVYKALKTKPIPSDHLKPDPKETISITYSMDFLSFKKVFEVNKRELKKLIPYFNQSRFNFIHDDDDNEPATKILKTEDSTPKFTSLGDTIIYSYVGSFLSNRDVESLADHICDLVQKKVTEGLMMVFVVVQLALDNPHDSIVGNWLSAKSKSFEKPADGKDSMYLDIQFKSNLCVMALFQRFLNSSNSTSDLDILNNFNENNGTELYLPEFVLLQCLKRYPQNRLKDCIDHRCSFLENFDENVSLSVVFVPMLDLSQHQVSWESSSDIFDYPAEIEIMKDIKEFTILENDDTEYVFFSLAREMRKEWIMTYYLHSLLRFFVWDRMSRVKNVLYSNFIARVQLVSFTDEEGSREYGVMLSNKYNTIECLENLDNIVGSLECFSYPGYEFLATTLGVFLRILAELNPRLEIPQFDSNYFYAETNHFPLSGLGPSVLFSFPQPEESEEGEMTITSKSNVIKDIPKQLSTFVISKGWLDISLMSGRYDIGSVYGLFAHLKEILNCELLIKCGAEFLGKLYNIAVFGDDSLEFIKFDVGLDKCNEMFVNIAKLYKKGEFEYSESEHSE